jgi:vacuolar-type H+-ATPase subunit I/STV1
MVKKEEFSLIRVEINRNYKDQFLMELSKINAVHIKQRTKPKIKESTETKDPTKQNIKDLRKSLNTLFKRLETELQDILDLKIDKSERIEFIAGDFSELIDHITEEIDFYSNRVSELKSYIAKGIIELENIKTIKSSYKYLETKNLTSEILDKLQYFNLRVYTTFSKNLANLKNLFDSSEFPNYYETFELSDDRIGFFIIYPSDRENEFNGRIRLIHSEEVQLLKKYLTKDGVNFKRINKELNFIENLVSRYQKEYTRIAQDNLLKFASINEIVQNIEEYNWAEEQFELIAPNRLSFKFFIPSKRIKTIVEDLFSTFKDNITIQSIDVPKKKEIFESYGRKTKRLKKPKEKDIFQENVFDKDNSQEPEEKREDLRDTAPTIMKNFILFRPFEMITKMYGTPTYSEIDPTPFIAITFPILFGLMFGDIGHGLTLIISGLLGILILKNRKKTFKSFCWIIIFCGVASLFVGFLYGEFFGKDEIEIFGKVYLRFESIKISELISFMSFGIIRPEWIPFFNFSLYNPLDNILSVFYFTILIGVFHITLGWFIQFLNYWKQNRRYLAFSDSFIKILLLIGGYILIFNFGFDIYTWMAYPYPILLTLIPGILLLVSKPIGKAIGISYLQEESFGGLIGEGTIETFETVLSVMSNVLSYIRLLALALAHIALIFSFNEMGNLIEGEGFFFELLKFVGAIFGNLVVIVIEGLLVFINTMRLHYYEFFFKFFKGTGIEYFPFYLDSDYSIMTFQGETEEDVISEEIEKEIDTLSAKEEIDKAISYISKKYE